jgi:hypothetical protein
MLNLSTGSLLPAVLGHKMKLLERPQVRQLGLFPRPGAVRSRAHAKEAS